VLLRLSKLKLRWRGRLNQLVRCPASSKVRPNTTARSTPPGGSLWARTPPGIVTGRAISERVVGPGTCLPPSCFVKRLTQGVEPLLARDDVWELRDRCDVVCHIGQAQELVHRNLDVS
jgi:hypothetical protein